MKNFINLKDIPASDLRKIVIDAKKRKSKRKTFNTLDVDGDKPLKGKLIIQKLIKGENVDVEISGLSKREWNELMTAFDLKDKLI